jgi:hypothetical protein
MSQAFDSTDYIERTANLPTRTSMTIGAWFLLPASLNANGRMFSIGSNGYAAEIAMLRYSNDHGAFRFGHANTPLNLSSNPAANQWVYFFLRNDATNLTCGWKRIADSSFYTETMTELGGNNIGVVRIGTDPFFNTLVTSVFRATLWNEPVTDENLLLAAANDLGYNTNVNTHLPLSSGIALPWSDTSGNGRDWTNVGSFVDGADPNLGTFMAQRAVGPNVRPLYGITP